MSLSFFEDRPKAWRSILPWVAVGLAVAQIWSNYAMPSLRPYLWAGFMLVILSLTLWRPPVAMSPIAAPSRSRRRLLVGLVGLLDAAAVAGICLWPAIALPPAVAAVGLTRLGLRGLGPRYNSWIGAREQALDDYHRTERLRARNQAASTIAAVVMIGVILAIAARWRPADYQMGAIGLGLVVAWMHLPILILAWRDPEVEDGGEEE